MNIPLDNTFSKKISRRGITHRTTVISNKGIDILAIEDADEDVFFHMEDIGGPDLEEGQDLEFEIVQADKGPRAKNVERL
jgi:CspA family cold shock protein